MQNTEQVTKAQAAHEILAREFTDRYLQRSGMGAIAYSAAYDPDDPLCDYERTWWEAKPNRLSSPLGKAVMGKMHGISPKEIEDLFVSPFAAKAEDLNSALMDFPVALVNSHDIDLQAALSLLSASMGIARERTGGSYQRALEETIKMTHGVATRGLAPIIVGRPRLPRVVTFVRLQRLVVNPHLSFPINKQMIESGIPEDFRKAYNAKLRAETIEVARSRSNHAKGYWTLWSMSPGGTPDIPGEGEHEGKLLTKRIEPATIKLMNEMGCGLLPVYTRLGRGKSPTIIELGEILPPNEVTDSTIPSMMADLAEFRRRNGEPQVFYEGELDSGSA